MVGTWRDVAAEGWKWMQLGGGWVNYNVGYGITDANFLPLIIGGTLSGPLVIEDSGEAILYKGDKR
jgi:hypothetical protein